MRFFVTVKMCLASLHPRPLSGQIDSLAGLARAMTDRGHAVRVVAPFDTTGILEKSLPALDSGPCGLGAGAAAMAKAIPSIIGAARECDLLHLAAPTPAFAWVADIAKAALDVPVLASFEGHLADAREVGRAIRRPGAFKGGLPLWAVNNGLFARATARSCDRYAVSSEFQREELVALGYAPESIAVIPNVVETSKLAGCDPLSSRLDLGLPERVPLAGYLGHFNDVKGVDVLADAFASLARQRPDVHLALAWSGQGDAAPIRRALASCEDRVHWLGKVHVGTFLCALDVLALPYRSTSGQGLYPSLILEAFHAGRPLVTSDLPLLREIAEDERVALLCPPDRPDLLAEQIDRALTSEPLRRRMARDQLALARERLAPPALAVRYEALYASLLTAAADELRAAA